MRYAQQYIDSLHRVLAFYGFDYGDTVWRQFYEWSMALFQRYGCKLWKIALGRRYLGVKHAQRKIIECNSRGFRGLTVTSIPADVKSDLEAYWLSSSVSDYSRVCYVDFDSQVESSDTALVGLASQLAEFLRPHYGLIFDRKLGLEPAGYALGMSCSNLKDEAEALRISWWTEGYASKVFLKGQIRDVYRWNFLNESHLSYPIEGVAFREWVGQCADRGTLKPFSHALALWEVPAGAIAKVKKTLRKADMVYDYEKTFAASIDAQMSGEKALGKVMGAFGMSAENSDVLHVEREGQLRALSPDEVSKITRANKRKS
jgi:hypothetical protein